MAHMETAEDTSIACCTACTESPQNDWRWAAPCGHEFCITYLESLLRSCVANAYLPPTCCVTSALSAWQDEDVIERLPRDLTTELTQKQIELQTADRTYCSVPACSAFIGAEHHISDRHATCPACESLTCLLCKAAAHTGDCPVDEAFQELLFAAGAWGWKRCAWCKAMIERVDGCNEMR